MFDSIQKPEEINQLYADVVADWVDAGIPPRKPTAAQLTRLAQLWPRQLLVRYATTLPQSARVIDIVLVDLDQDGDKELLVACQNGIIYKFPPPTDSSTWDFKTASEPTKYQMIGLQAQPATYAGGAAVYVVVRQEKEDGRLELYYDKDRLQHVHRPRSLSTHHIKTGYLYGLPTADGLWHAVLVEEAQRPCLRGITPLGQVAEKSLSGRPTMLVHTAYHAWVGDDRESLWCWRWHGQGWVKHETWPEAGVPVNGQPTAAALWLRPITEEANDWLLLLATNERKLLVIDMKGETQKEIPLPHTITAMVADLERGCLYATFDNEELCCMQPVWEPLSVPAFPALPSVLGELSLTELEGQLQAWLHSGRIDCFVSVLDVLLREPVPAQPPIDELLPRLLPAESDQLTAKERFRILEVVADAALRAEKVDDVIVSYCLFIASKWQRDITLSLSRGVDLLVGRLAARFGKNISANRHYQAIRENRKMGDLTLAENLVAQGRVENNTGLFTSALSLYAQVLADRRQVRWLFAADTSPRGVVSMRESGQVFLTTWSGRIYHLDLATSPTIKDSTILGGETGRHLPHALAAGRLFNEREYVIAMATAGGQIFIGPASSNSKLADLMPAFNVNHNIQGLDIVPRDRSHAPQLVLCYRHQIVQYCQTTAGQWQLEGSVPLPVEWINTLKVSSLVKGTVPVILVGGAVANGKGSLFLLNLDGSEYAHYEFNGAVLDVVMVARRSSSDKQIAVACDDGYVYLLKHNGTQQWRYQVGLTARNLAACDVDGDGSQEVIVGAETRSGENMVLILDVSGAIKWHIPATASITHVSSVMSEDGQPLLMMIDLNQALHVVQVNPPGGGAEREIRAAARGCLDELARRSEQTGMALTMEWLTSSTPERLAGYALSYLAGEVCAGNYAAAETLTSVDTSACTAPVQQAYAQALVDAACYAEPGSALLSEIVERLVVLLRDAGTASRAGISTLRHLMLPDRLQTGDLETWMPVLRQAATHAEAEVQRAVLYALRHLQPFDKSEATLPPHVWEILRLIRHPNSSADDWVFEDLAAFLRDMVMPENETLWILAHRALIELARPGILSILGSGDSKQRSPRLLDSEPLAEAIQCLANLYSDDDNDDESQEYAPQLEALIQKLREAELPPPHGQSYQRCYYDIYRLLETGLESNKYEEWLQFVGDRLYGGGLGRLGELLDEIVPSSDRQTNELFQQLMRELADFQTKSSLTTDSVARIKESLSRLAQEFGNRWVSASDQERRPPMFARHLAGLLGRWVQSDGPLEAKLEMLMRPPRPEIRPGQAIRRGDEVILEVILRNAGHAGNLEDISVQLDKTSLAYGDETHSCSATTETPVKGIHIESQGERLLRLRAILSPTAPADQIAELTITVRYFLPPTEWKSYADVLKFDEIIHKTRATLEWEQDLPRTAELVIRDLESKLKQRKPILLEAAPFSRPGLINAVNEHLYPSSRLIEIDLRQWMHTQTNLETNHLVADEGEFLVWLASCIWPDTAAQSSRIRGLGVPRQAFKDLARTQVLSRGLLLNHWERLLLQMGRKGDPWQPLQTLFPFLIAWTREINIPLILIGTFLSEEIMRQRWPEMAEQFIFVRCDQTNQDDPRVQKELEDAISRLIKERNLEEALKYFTPPITVPDLIRLCGGYLHFLEFVALDGLEQLNEEQQGQTQDWVRYMVNYAREVNFFNALWMWQDFFDRVAIVMVAHGEIPLQEAGWVEEGLILSRPYHPRQADGRLATEARLPADHTLFGHDLTIIRSSQQYRSGDAWVRGFRLNQPIQDNVDLLFRQLLRAGGGQDRLDRLVRLGILRRRRSRHLSDFYELNVPLHGHWLRQSSIWNHMRGAAQSRSDSWYPTTLALDHRPAATVERRSPFLFAGKYPSTAHQDIPFAALPAIQQQLQPDTLPLWLNLYGLSGRGQTHVPARWHALVKLAEAVQSWPQIEPTTRTGSESNPLTLLAESFPVLLNLEFSARSERPLTLYTSAQVALAPFAWGFIEFANQATLLRKQILLLFVHDGRTQAEKATALRHWARETFQTLIEQADANHVSRQDQQERQRQWEEMIERSVVLTIVARDLAPLRRALPPGRGGPHFVFFDLPRLTELIMRPDPDRELFNYAFDDIGRHSFSPYKLYGSLAGGSPLFVGRKKELTQILQSLHTDDHAVLGSRRIGKTSLLHELAYRLRQPGYQERMLTLLLRLGDGSNEDGFYAEIRHALGNTEHAHFVKDLPVNPQGNYTALREVMQTLSQQYGHPVVILIDEIDGLYLWDRNHNRQRLFQFLRNNLAQTQPRLCTFIITGYRYILLDRRRHGSVFFNFCHFHNFASIEPDGVEHLVLMLRELQLEIREPEQVIHLVQQGTYAIPYFVQRTCDDLLRRVDRQPGKDWVDVQDVQTVLETDIRQRLRRELWDELLSEVPLLSTSSEERSDEPWTRGNLKCRIILLATILERYQHKFDASLAHIPLSPQAAIFTATDMITNLQELYPELIPSRWAISEGEVHRLLSPLTMTLALGVTDTEELAYYFPNDILPDVLYFYQNRPREKIDLINELDRYVQELLSQLT